MYFSYALIFCDKVFGKLIFYKGLPVVDGECYTILEIFYIIHTFGWNAPHFMIGVGCNCFDDLCFTSLGALPGRIISSALIFSIILVNRPWENNINRQFIFYQSK